MKFIIDKLKEKKGVTAIEIGIGTLLVILCICTMVDLTQNMYKFSALSSTANYVSRTVSRQGGISSSRPEGYNGEFSSTSDIYNNVKTIMNNAGIEDNEFLVTVSGSKLYGHNSSPTKYKGNDIDVVVEIKYDWDTVGGMIGIVGESDKTVKRTVTSNLIKRHDDITSEIK